MTDITNADEQNNIVDGQETTNVAALEAELAKAREEAGKWEGRYKSTQKKANESKPEGNDVDVSELVKRETAIFKEEFAFSQKHGADALTDEIRAVKEKHPSLSLEDAMKLTASYNDTAARKDVSTGTMAGAQTKSYGETNRIAQADLAAMPQAQYEAVMAKISKGEIILE